MTTSSETPQDTVPHSDSASEPARIGVLIRLTPDEHREMRRAMAELGVRKNQDFGRAAIAEKAARVFGKRTGDDRRKAERRVA